MHYLQIPDYIYPAVERLASFRGIKPAQVVEEALFWYINLMGHKIGLVDVNSELLDWFYEQYADMIAGKVVEKLEQKGRVLLGRAEGEER